MLSQWRICHFPSRERGLVLVIILMDPPNHRAYPHDRDSPIDLYYDATCASCFHLKYIFSVVFGPGNQSEFTIHPYSCERGIFRWC